MLKWLDASLAPTAAIILIIGAGGGFKQMLVTSGVGDVIGHMAVQRADLADPAGMAGGGGDSYRDRFGDRGDHHWRGHRGAGGGDDSGRQP
jgi:hypothetical protein